MQISAHRGIHIIIMPDTHYLNICLPVVQVQEQDSKGKAEGK